jgi:hypothetical protein
MAAEGFVESQHWLLHAVKVLVLLLEARAQDT